MKRVVNETIRRIDAMMKRKSLSKKERNELWKIRDTYIATYNGTCGYDISKEAMLEELKRRGKR